MRKALKKLLAVTMAFTLLFTSVAVLGNVAAAANIDFVWENGKRIGIKTIKLNDLTYFDLDNGRSTIDNNKISVIELYRKVLTTEYGATPPQRLGQTSPPPYSSKPAPITASMTTAGVPIMT